MVLIHGCIQRRTPVKQHSQDLHGIGRPIQRVLQQLPSLHVSAAAEQFFNELRWSEVYSIRHEREDDIRRLVQVGPMFE